MTKQGRACVREWDLDTMKQEAILILFIPATILG